MARRMHAGERRWRSFLILLLTVCTCLAAYFFIRPLLFNLFFSQASLAHVARQHLDNNRTGCCRGIEHTELWGDAVNWGNDFLLDTAQECCNACKTNPTCDSWVHCADEANCGSFYRQCWLKRQKNSLDPESHDSGPSNPWTSGLVLDKDMAVVGLSIDNGTMSGQLIHLKLLPDCAPSSVLQILDLAKLTHCAGCRFYRAEGRAGLWDSYGGHNSKMRSTGPPYAVVQGTLEAHHVPFKQIPKEYTPAILRGMVGWLGGGPDFFISLADHVEWPRKHSVFATVADDDISLIETLAELPTTTATWEGVPIQVLDKPVNIRLVHVDAQRAMEQ
ncbi:uncharacterized protein [Physcomitrium patens]|uniref:Uncharacterized protein n=1 Tax=Physcomitrium patens TaxID=3218 RepID=A0A7I4AW16_PHYPA|nr:uncharacterized protein LOC112292037 [Physcomitrium patens]XP_024395898.1 uncharacterized protein LOC112292037 [Physcomitrium patens]XP_024395899.1 uncharacterized protein LOC112292037 [Physcomitrium patens]XP_024395900.1 uncharacterized protein LOC112292037 [Physcomitrium patens]XP_024395901.1 uncharacterized protein LOC112292037 [Physcomitrium patens]XP_024395902.1 uncharacterized protein LOC112292037 [Physcomitrium patens]|eukprot:XP_024395896.1 uncharacterized protein LOC112292037 [Physcomitrella patens]